ncbi:MAG: alpha-glucan family phosphorylase [Phycisphaerales bacterium]|nr:alpha-glucan family phosphorylase [Phycisphaerales bacterium]
MPSPKPEAFPEPSEVRNRLLAVARNVSWSWHEIAQRPFSMLDPVAWEASNHAPIETVHRAGEARIEAAANDRGFLKVLAAAEQDLEQAEHRTRWFQESGVGGNSNLLVAYYCSEFAIHESMQQYSGGLGVLAGDHLKSAEDLGVPMIGIGLLYQHGYYRQQFEADGRTRVLYPRYDFANYPIEDTGTSIHCPIGDRTVEASIRVLRLGRTPIYLLDADLAGNSPEDRILTEGLYKGDNDLRMRQQVLLGVGGAMAIEALGEPVNVHHLNEGHAAFAAAQRIARKVEEGHDLQDAIAQVRSTTVFTTHTPVPAGHDRYQPGDVVGALWPVLERTGLSAEAFSDLGRVRPGDSEEPFCMTVLALRLARHVNGVAQLHGEVTREMWKDVYGLDEPAEVPIGAITNGVHPGTWIDPAAARFWKKNIGLRLDRARPTTAAWAKAKTIDLQEAWDLRCRLRERLVGFVRARAVRQARERGADPEAILAAGEVFREDALTIGFARRFATYKRSPLVFTDQDRLADILNDPDCPVQLVFAGKAHPRDEAGQAFARKIHRMAERPEFRGKVVLLEEYDMRIGRELTSGCDIWLNNPIRPHEASGTSGMKPPMHLGLNFSILDGWWPEGFDGHNGWVIEGEPTSSSARARDLADAESLYEVLEDEIVPEFFTRNRNGIPRKWVNRSLRAASTVPNQFSTHRMVAEYLKLAYLPACHGE